MVMGDMEMSTDLLVIGGGPGGYGAAFRAADLGLDVIMVDAVPRPGGVCLHKGCIPSKTFLHLAELILDARRAKKMGLTFGEPKLDLAAMIGLERAGHRFDWPMAWSAWPRVGESCLSRAGPISRAQPGCGSQERRSAPYDSNTGL